MQVLLAGDHKFLLLELDPDFVGNIAKQAGFEYKIEDNKRWLGLDLLAADRQAPLLLQSIKFMTRRSFAVTICNLQRLRSS